MFSITFSSILDLPQIRAGICMFPLWPGAAPAGELPGGPARPWRHGGVRDAGGEEGGNRAA